MEMAGEEGGIVIQDTKLPSLNLIDIVVQRGVLPDRMKRGLDCWENNIEHCGFILASFIRSL
jgi:hypothetical protein